MHISVIVENKCYKRKINPTDYLNIQRRGLQNKCEFDINNY